MSSHWPMVPLGDLLSPSGHPHAVFADQTYSNVGIYSFGRGLFKKSAISGSTSSARTLFQIHAGQFIYSRLFAFEGAYGVVPDAFDGFYVSNEYPTFDINHDRLDPDFLLSYFQRKATWEQAASLAVGMGDRRRRIQPQDLLRHEMPLPPLETQRWLAERLRAIVIKISEAKALRKAIATQASALDMTVSRKWFPPPQGRFVRDYVSLQTGYAFRSEWFADEGVRLARNVNVGHGLLDWTNSARISLERRAEFERFELKEGDILISLDRPIISTGVKVARVRSSDLPALLLQRVARVHFDTNELLPAYFFRWLQSSHFVNEISPGRSNGVPHISHKDIEKLPFAAPNVREQAAIVDEIEKLASKMQSVNTLRDQAARELDAMLPAILDRAFRGELI